MEAILEEKAQGHEYPKSMDIKSRMSNKNREAHILHYYSSDVYKSHLMFIIIVLKYSVRVCCN